jgi:hypothetical protein
MDIGGSIDAPIRLCADPTVAPQDVSKACKDKCDKEWCTYSVNSSFPFIGNITCPITTLFSPASCLVQQVTPVGPPCDTGSDPAGPSREDVNMTANIVVTSNGHTGPTTLRGNLRYTLSSGGCTGTVCPFKITDINVHADPVKVGDHTFSGTITSQNIAIGTIDTSTHLWEIAPPDGLSIAVEFFIDNNEGSESFSSGMAGVMGTADPDADVFTINGGFTDGNNDSVTVDLRGTHLSTPPIAVINPKGPIECNAPRSANVTLDGTSSSDRHGSIAHVWWWLGNPPNQASVGLTATTPATLAYGPNTIQLDLMNDDSSIGNDRANIQVVDTTPPTVDALQVDPPCLWAPDHKLVLYELGTTLSAHATDICDPSPIVTIANVTSNQPALGGGQGNFAPDVFFGQKAFCVRSEREGTSAAPRQYTVTVQAEDFAGNKTQRSVSIAVPHDQGGAKCPLVDPSRVVEDGDPRCVAN